MGALDIDMVVHESFHIIQAYPGGGNTPGWAVEGLANYARSQYGGWNLLSGWSSNEPAVWQSYQSGYDVTARFLHWLEVRVRSGIVDRLNTAMQRLEYSDAFRLELTGKTVEELWAAYIADPRIP